MRRDRRRLAIDIVVPVYNEEAVVAEFHRQLIDVVDRGRYVALYEKLRMAHD